METLTVVQSRAGIEVERLDDFDVTEALAEADPAQPQDVAESLDDHARAGLPAQLRSVASANASV